jgi:hypothetical protein
MALITSTTNQVAAVNEIDPEITTYKAAVALTPGQWVYLNSAGKVDLARANGVATAQCVGVVLQTVGPNQAVNVLQRGSVAGFDLSALAYGAVVYLSSATAGGADGAIITGTGNVVTPLGTVKAMTDPALTKVLWVNCDLLRAPAALP